MLLHPKQKIIARDTHRFRVLRCGRRFGKTTLLVEEMKGMAVARPSRIAYIAKNYQQARDIAWDTLKKEMEGAILSINEARLEMRVKTVDGKESIIFLRGWESVENLLGQSFDLLCIDEVAYMENFWVGWENVLRPTLMDRKGIAIFASTPNGFNHFYDLCNKELTDIDYKTFHFKTSDNPFIPKEEIERLKETLPPDVFAQEHDAEFVKKSGLVYKEFDREKHLYDELPEECRSWDYIAGVDFGYQNPAAVLHIYTDGDRFYVEDEWYKKERTDAQIAEYVASYNFKAVYPDPECAGGIEELRRRRVNTREVKKGKGTIQEGIQKIRELLLANKLKINRKCVNLISEFEMYSYEESKDTNKSLKEIPVKAFDHGLDALRYVVLTYKPIGHIFKQQETFWNKNRFNNLNSTR